MDSSLQIEIADFESTVSEFYIWWIMNNAILLIFVGLFCYFSNI